MTTCWFIWQGLGTRLGGRGGGGGGVDQPQVDQGRNLSIGIVAYEQKKHLCGKNDCFCRWPADGWKDKNKDRLTKLNLYVPSHPVWFPSRFMAILWGSFEQFSTPVEDNPFVLVLHHKQRQRFEHLGYVQTKPDRFSRRHRKLCCVMWTPIRYGTHHFRDRGDAASIRFRNRAEITVLMCEQKPLSVWFSYRCKSYAV